MIRLGGKRVDARVNAYGDIFRGPRQHPNRLADAEADGLCGVCLPCTRRRCHNQCKRYCGQNW